jgi:ubiquinone biosynthesis UbiH/UbiF/VisC/COQ6 family hydroxylase
LTNGEVISAPLVVAADSRFSSARKQMGIPASMTDFGRSAIVCRMEHDQPHGEIAQECFFDAWTLAILPLQGNKSSIVITLPTDQVDEVMSLTSAAFNARITKGLGDKLGSVRLTGQRYSYPLVAVFAGRFASHRFALMGDAAVGMHPVTAHGYNLGLLGAHTLARELRKSLALGLDIGDGSALEAYALAHRRASAFLYYGTNAMVNVYTDNRSGVLGLRALGLRIANRLPPFKRYVTRQLTGKG